jgi:hypothetical protein
MWIENLQDYNVAWVRIRTYIFAWVENLHLAEAIYSVDN